MASTSIDHRTNRRAPAATATLTRNLLLSLLCCGVAAAPCMAQGPATATATLAPLATTAAATPPSPWRAGGLPKQSLPKTRFDVVDVDGRRALRVEADRSYGNLVHPLGGSTAPLQLSWQWRVDQALADADLKTKAGDDTAVKVCVFFDLALDKIPFGERQLLRMARAHTAEPLPGATLCYVWDTRAPVNTAVHNAYTGRVRYLVLQSGPAHLRQWRAERRDVAADFTRLFGDESSQMPPVVGIAVGADADNTGGRSLAYVTDLVAQP